VEAAHFILTDSGEFEPTRFAGSHWGDDHLNGPAVVGLAARTLELHYGSASRTAPLTWSLDNPTRSFFGR
jgi:hypothetical protein